MSHKTAMEYEKCYIFEKDDSRPHKRRRTEPSGLQASWHLRKKAYQQAWQKQQKRIYERLNTINATTVEQVAAFLDDVATDPHDDSRIPTGLILAGPNSALRTSIVSQVSAHSTSGLKRQFISLSSGSGNNLKGLLKVINQKATSQTIEDEEDEISSKKGPKLLNYDLQILSDHVQERHLQQVVIAFEDTEAFDSDLLLELIELLACWQDRIPFAFLLNVATSVEFLQQRLSKGAIRCLDGRLFDAAVSSDETEQVFDAIANPDCTLWLGPNLFSMILDRQSDYIQGIDSLRDAAKYAYMSHYYANALSLFLDPGLSIGDVPTDHFEALRNLPSFRVQIRQMLDSNKTTRVRQLLDSDDALFERAKTWIEDGKAAISRAILATQLLRQVQEHVPYTAVSSKSSLYLQTLSGKLNGSPLLRSLILSIKKLPSDTALSLIATVSEASLHGIDEIQCELSDLITTQNQAQPLRSEHDVSNSTLRTTVVAQKVELSKQKSTLSKQDAAYTDLIRKFAEILQEHFNSAFINLKDLPLHEIFLYDLRSPYREVFTPRPRHAIERALAAPHDYLDCDCCTTTEEATLAATQPATAILYQLYLESGNLINASDLWQAFQAVTEGDDQIALFQRGLAELKYLGLVKGTRKRVDHVAKVAWRGL